MTAPGFVGEVETPAVEFEVAGVGPPHARRQMRQLGAPGPDQPAERQHLAGKDVEADALHGAPPGDIADREDGLAGSIGREALPAFGRTDIVADDGADQPLLVEAPPRRLVDDPAVAQHGDPVAQLEDLVEAMGDIEDRDAMAGKIANDREELLGFRTRKGCGGLVHGDHAGVARQRLADHHEPAVGDGEFGDSRFQREAACRCARPRRERDVLERFQSIRPKRVALRTPSSMFCRALKWGMRLSS